MCFAAAEALANHVGDKLGPDHILPTMDDWNVFAYEAAAVGQKAIEQGVARQTLSYDGLYDNALRMIKRSHEITRMMMAEEFIAKSPIV
jgi:malate dehydrogenase (oxaloacetate-decarboxylating)